VTKVDELGYLLLAVVAVWLLFATLWSVLSTQCGAGLQWLACRMQVAARWLWEAGRRMENENKGGAR